MSPDAVAHELAAANRAAFAERYAGGYSTSWEPYTGLDRSAGRGLQPVEIVKACDCLDYQASDWTAWDASEAAAHLAAIRAAALARCLGGRYLPDTEARTLPGYDLAAWELPEPAPVEPVAEPVADLATEARALVAALRGMAVHPSHYAGLVAALERADLAGGAA